MSSNPTSPANVLVVEDDEHIRVLLQFILERQGYRVDACGDGRVARDYIETSSELPALILLDVMLPFFDGFELVRVIRSRQGWESVPIVMLTAKTTESDIVRALDAGANDYVVKPFQPNELLARLRRFLREKNELRT
jgi:DNA-binding response OmpR family regulator